MLDRVRDVGRRAVDPRFFECAVEEPAGGADEGSAGFVLLVAGLFADKHHGGGAGALAEDGLRPDLPEQAAATSGRCLAQLRQGRRRGDERGGCLGVHALEVPSHGGYETPSSKRCSQKTTHQEGTLRL